MYRILRPTKDAYITDKAIRKRRSYNSNTGLAGTLDLYSLFDESYVYDASGSLLTSSVREKSRVLIEFDYAKIQELEDRAKIDLNSSNYTCSLKLIDVYGGQSTPNNFVLELLPLALAWSEGRGSDVVAYQHVDATNWITASLSGSQAVTWSLPGASATGSLTDLNVDVYVSGNLGSGNQFLGKTAFFATGAENLEIDVTNLVSASLGGLMPNNGFRIAYTEGEEEEDKTYFVKRFGTRHAQNVDLRPRLDVTTTADIIRCDKARAAFSPLTQKFFLFNESLTGYSNFYNGGQEITGANCLVLSITTSKDVKYLTSSFSVPHNMTISYLTKSIAYFSTSFNVSQFTIGSQSVPGTYYADVLMDPYQNADLLAYLSGSVTEKVKFSANWLNPINEQVLHKEKIFFAPYAGIQDTNIDRNYVMNIYNLKSLYSKQANGYQRFRVYIQDYNTEMTAYQTPCKQRSEIVPGMKYRVKKAYQNIEYIPFCAATELSYDENGMFFDLYITDFDVGSVYQVDFVIPSGNGSSNDVFVENQGWRFKVVD